MVNYLSIMPAQVLESVVKNCGQTVHDEVASKQTMEELKELLKVLCLQPIVVFLISFSILSYMWTFSWHVAVVKIVVCPVTVLLS